MSDLLQVEKKKQTLWLTLNRPEVHNAFNSELIERITKEFERIERDKDVNLVVLTGKGKSFCAGADLNWMKSMVNFSQEENIADSKKLAEMFRKIDNCHVPVIGKINGHALGGGMGLIAVCDYVIAKDGGKFGFTETNLGLIPAVISPFCIKKIGHSQARALFISGEKFSARKAYEINLVHQILDEDEFDQAADELIQKFENLPNQAIQVAKELVKQVEALSPDEVEEFTCLAIANQRVSAEGQEGMSALLEKRKPNWNQND